MRIIKHGNQLLYKEQIHVCENCECEFAFTLKDIQSRFGYNEDKQMYESVIYVACPECHLAYPLNQ